MSNIEIYDSVVVHDDMGEFVGIVMKITETSVKSAMPDMKGISTNVTTKVDVLVMPDMRVKSYMSEKVTKNATRPENAEQRRKQPHKIAQERIKQHRPAYVRHVRLYLILSKFTSI